MTSPDPLTHCRRHTTSQPERLLREKQRWSKTSKGTTRERDRRTMPRSIVPGSASQRIFKGGVRIFSRPNPVCSLHLLQGFIRKGFTRCNIQFHIKGNCRDS